MSGRLDGKVAVITGGASGIGAATARRFVEEGACVVIGDIAVDAGRDLADRLGGAAAFMVCDVTRDDDIAGLVREAVERYQRVDCMFNNAGSGVDTAQFREIVGAGFDRSVALLARSVVLGHKYAAREMARQGGGGSIISTASVAGSQGGWANLSYSAAKAAVISLVRSASAELGSLGIRSNALAPGIILTPITLEAFGVDQRYATEWLEHLRPALDALQPIGRVGQAEDVANAALWLASDESSFVTGHTLVVDGGASAVNSRGSDLWAAGRRAAADFVAGQPVARARGADYWEAPL